MPARADSSQILQKVLFNLASAIGECGAVVKVRSDLPVLAVHEVHLVQLLQNLLANAIKYRKPGEKPQISVGALRDGSRWVFSIKDNGIGIQPQYRERVFGIFKRLHGREYPGTGIGLALCRRIVESYGGAIWVESEPDRGSTFFFTLPAAE